MRIYRILSTALGGVFMAGMSTSAFAGCGGAATCDSITAYESVPSVSCIGPAPVVNCNPGVSVYGNSTDALSNVGVYNSTPYGHLKSVEYKNSQNVNIMRVHSRAPSVSLADSPSAFTGGCTPTSTAYCRAPGAMPVQVKMNRAPAPIVAAPVSPCAPQPTCAPRVTYGSGYNPAAFAPRQYGTNDFTPGIAHVPTSIVDRSPITHINGIPQPQVQSVTTAPLSYARPVPVAMPAPRGNVIGHRVTGQYTYQPPGGGAYWEKTSGPTMVGGMMATQIICRREAPRPAPVTVNVVSPVIGVPTPVCAPAPKQCAPMGCAPASRYGQSASRWTY
jgi:hypothetical protein